MKHRKVQEQHKQLDCMVWDLCWKWGEWMLVRTIQVNYNRFPNITKYCKVELI